MNGSHWLAHSARPKRGIPTQPYAAHLGNVLHGRALPALESMLACYCGSERLVPERLRAALLWAGTFHDLGKLNDENQNVLCSHTSEPLPYIHESAGALHCLECGQTAAAFAIHSHHQGLTNASAEFEQFSYCCLGEPCRPFVREGEFTKTAELLPVLRLRHAEDSVLRLPSLPQEPVRVLRWQSNKRLKAPHLTQLEMRLLLSLLVDADHGDTSHHYGQDVTAQAPKPRWAERLQALEIYVAALGKDKNGDPRPGPRDPLRKAVYRDCVECDPEVPIYACDAPVGSGKTTAVMAYLLRAAINRNLRHIFVVLPFTNIIQQSVDVYRKALVLKGEDPEQVVAENHHVAEFQSAEARGLTALWRAPVVVTTAVQFFETLAARTPSRLRKLHMLPGSAVFVDEAHTAMPLALWPSMYARLEDLTRNWSCRFVLGSGSLPRFWENTRLFPTRPSSPPVMLKPETVAMGATGERNRVSFHTNPVPQTLKSLVRWLKALSGARLIVMNTLHSAAALARTLADGGVRTLHLSTALTPSHRERVLSETGKLLAPENRDAHGFVMVATSSIEAGVDLSFDIALRERSSVSSLIQISGRVNRNANRPTAEVWDFRASDPLLTANPSLNNSRMVVEQAFRDNLFDRLASDAMTIAVAEECKRSLNPEDLTKLRTAEQNWEFATVAELSQLVVDDPVTAVVDPILIARLKAKERVRHTELVRGSVSIRKAIAQKAGLCNLDSLQDDRLYVWPEGQYDEKLLGTMRYLLTLKDVSDQKLAMI